MFASQLGKSLFGFYRNFHHRSHAQEPVGLRICEQSLNALRKLQFGKSRRNIQRARIEEDAHSVAAFEEGIDFVVRHRFERGEIYRRNFSP